MLSKHPDKCRFPHGHSRKVECVLEAPDLDDWEMVCDFKVLKLILNDYLDRFDHAMCMNTDDPAYEEFKERYGDRVIGYESQDPTTEVEFVGGVFGVGRVLKFTSTRSTAASVKST